MFWSSVLTWVSHSRCGREWSRHQTDSSTRPGVPSQAGPATVTTVTELYRPLTLRVWHPVLCHTRAQNNTGHPFTVSTFPTLLCTEVVEEPSWHNIPHPVRSVSRCIVTIVVITPLDHLTHTHYDGHMSHDWHLLTPPPSSILWHVTPSKKFLSQAPKPERRSANKTLMKMILRIIISVREAPQ